MPVLAIADDSGGGDCGPWDIDLSCVEGIPEDTDPALIARWQQVASDRLWARSGRQFGVCTRNSRPCKKSCAAEYGITGGPWSLTPYIVNGEWYNAATCGCRQDCSCSELCEVFLPGPVRSVTEVRIDGAVLDPDAYRVDAPGWLVREDGLCWPACQDLAAPAQEDGTFVVSYEYGLPLTAAAIAAVSAYTAELIKDCLPDCDCRLPRDPDDIQSFLEKGLVGLAEVDQWITDVNPRNLPERVRVMSPDTGWMQPRTQIWP